jgi:hypothetical protein
MKRITLGLSMGLIVGLVALSAQTVRVPKTDRAVTDKAVTITGCVVEGTEAGSHTLEGATIVGNLVSRSTTAGTTGTARTAKSTSMEHSATYQLKGADLKDFVGRQVEAIGTTSDDTRTDKRASIGFPDTTKDVGPMLTVTSMRVLLETCS